MLAQIGKVDAPIVGPVALSVEYTPGDKIRRDVPGMLDAICHILERSGLVLDDAQVKMVKWMTRPVSPKKAHCIITLEECK